MNTNPSGQTTGPDTLKQPSMNTVPVPQLEEVQFHWHCCWEPVICIISGSQHGAGGGHRQVPVGGVAVGLLHVTSD